MSKLNEPPPVRLFAGLIYSCETLFEKCTGLMEKEFGKILQTSEEFDFSQTTYYEKEMGKNLKRKFVFFRKLINREQISGVKIICNDIENLLSENGRRKINIDPGYIAPEHVVLSTGKPYSHRVYLGKGVYAELTLIYENNGFRYMEWTYPDYKFKNIQDMFLDTRKVYLDKLKEGKLI